MKEDRPDAEKMAVEKASAADIDALARLRLEYLRENHGELDEKETEAIRSGLPGYFLATLNKELFAYVIREGQTIAACAFLLVSVKPMSPAFPNGRTGSVLNVYTRPAFRRRGYAKRIMETLLCDAEKMDLSLIELKATEAGYPLYKCVGFRDEEEKYLPMEWENKAFFG